MSVSVITLGGYAAGAVIGLSARPALIRGDDPLSNRYFGTAAVFALGAVAPAGLSLYGMFPDWSLMYLANPAHLSMWVMAPLLGLLYVVSPLAGYLITYRLMAQKQAQALKASLVIVSLMALLTLLIGWDRLSTVAYYDDFHYGGQVLMLRRSNLFAPLVLSFGAIAGVFVFTVMHLRRHVELAARVPGARSRSVSSAGLGQ